MKEFANRLEFININYTDEEKEHINKLKISTYESFIHCGTIRINKLTEYLKKIGNNDIKTINILKNIIKNLSTNIINTYKTKYFYLQIITSNQNDFVPRWHTDSPIFNRNNEVKFITTLKGPSTLFIKDEKYYRIYDNLNLQELTELKKYSDNKNISIIIDKYKKLIKQKFKNANILQPTNEQGVIMNVGNEKSALHLIPNIKQERFFISIMPGTKEEINILGNNFLKFNKMYHE